MEQSAERGHRARRLRHTEPAVTETVAEILDAYRAGTVTPEDIVARSFARIREHDDPAVFIALREEAELLGEARQLAQSGDERLPLYGIPVAVKDNIDVKGLPTTAACPAFSYRTEPGRRMCGSAARSRSADPRQDQSRSVRDRPCRRAVALRHLPQSVRSKTHTRRIKHGLRDCGRGGVRTACAGYRYRRIRAGAGRLQQHRRVKPSRGLVSTAGVVPACRTLDCVSVFALTVDDAMTMLNTIAGADAADPFSRSRPLRDVGPMPQGVQTRCSAAGRAAIFRRSRLGRGL